MKRLLIALAVLVTIGGIAYANGGGPLDPLYVREQQGTGRTYAEVTCTNAVKDVALIAASSTANARSIMLFNEDTTNSVVICPVAAAAGVCDTAAKGFTVFAKGNIPINRSVRDTAWSCWGLTADVIVGVLIEK